MAFPSYAEARQAMLEVLLAMGDDLPVSVCHAVYVAKTANDKLANESARVDLWESINGRDMEGTPDVLLTRLAICLLYAGAEELPDAMDTLAYFDETYRRLGASVQSLQPVTHLLASGRQA